MNTPGLLSCDWGTSSFRLRLVREGRLVAGIERAEGVREIHARLVAVGRASDPAARHDAFAAVLSSALEDLTTRVPGGLAGEPVIISGMASATVGWRELPYAAAPASLDGSGFLLSALPAHAGPAGLHEIRLVSGLTTGSDVMRGEECEVCGLLAQPGMEGLKADCLVILPGTHSKHIRIRDGYISDFRTHLTGELLELLSTRSLLAASVEWPPPAVPEPSAASMPEHPWGLEFDAGVRQVAARGLGASLFSVRVRSVLDGRPRWANAAYLAGLLIGAEMADLLAWESGLSPILLAASERFARPYGRALRVLGAGARWTEVPPSQVVDATLRTHALLARREGLLPGEDGSA